MKVKYPSALKYISTLLLYMILFSNTYGQKNIRASSAAEIQKGEVRRSLLESTSLINNIKLRNIGPTITSGRVVDLEVNPSNPVEFYVAYATGGLWHTENNGHSFQCISDNLPLSLAGDIAINWIERIIWLGTGEANPIRTSYAGNGIYKTYNNGKKWEYLGLPESHHIGKIILHPSDPNVAWVAVSGHLYSKNKERGIYKTTNGGKSWIHALYIDDSTGGIDIAINPLDSNILYAAMWHHYRSPWNLVESGKSSGIFKSENGGKSWKLITTAASGFPTGEAVGRIGLAVYPKNPDSIYALLDNFSLRPDLNDITSKSEYLLNDFKNLSKKRFGELEDAKFDRFLQKNGLNQYKAAELKSKVVAGIFEATVIADYFGTYNSYPKVIGAELYLSTDGGNTWKRTHEKSLDNFYYFFGYFFGKMAVSPSNSNKLLIGGAPLYLTEDGGKTFLDIGKTNVHGDHHAYWIDPNNDNHFIDGNDGGINITYDNGKNWVKANSPPVSQFYSVEVDYAKSYNVYGGMLDNGVWYGPSTYSAEIAYSQWTTRGQYPYKFLEAGDGMFIQVDWRDNKTYYTGFQFGNYSRFTLDNSLYKKSVKPSIKLGEKSLRFNWRAPILLSRHNQDVLYIGSNRFHRSLNKGESIETLSNDLTKGTKVGDVPFGTLTSLSESPLRFGLLYAGSDDGLVHMSMDGGYKWLNISSNLPKDLWISSITASKYKESRVYVSLTGSRMDHFEAYLFVSEDNGSSWRKLGNDLPLEPINVVKEDPKNEKILYVGTDNGLYVTINRGISFMTWTGGLPRVPIYDVTIQEEVNDIVVATHGRSIYIGSLDLVQLLTPDIISKKITIIQAQYNFKGNVGSINISSFTNSADSIIIKVTNEKGNLIENYNYKHSLGINILSIPCILYKGKYNIEIENSNGIKDQKEVMVE